MSINYAILGMLNCKPLTGYDLKKVMQDSLFMPWSGNSNQIYKALLELNDDGFVTSEVISQESTPAKKVYTITAAGLAELKRWTQSEPDIFETKKPFLVQLAWTDLLRKEELNVLLDQYEQQMKGQLLIAQKKAETNFFKEGRTSRETAIWELIHENIIASYASELNWIEKVRGTMNSFADITPLIVTDKQSNLDQKNDKEVENMTYQIIEKDDTIYILLNTTGKQIQTEQDGLDLVSICAQNDTHKLLIQGERLSDDFLQLSTGVAGAVLQKFFNYGIQAAVVLDESRTKGRFREFLTESQNGNMFRSYSNLEEAERWLISAS